VFMIIPYSDVIYLLNVNYNFFTFLEERKYMLSEIVHTVLDLYTQVVRNVMNAPLAIALIQVVMGIHLKNNNIEIIYIIQLQIVSLQSIYILEKK